MSGDDGTGRAAAVDAPTDFEPAGPEHDATLRRLLRENPVPGWISLSFEREPDYFAAAAVEGDSRTVLVREGARIVGMFSRSVHEAYLDGRPARLGYLGQLRVDRPARGRFVRVRRGYEVCRRLRAPDEAPFDLTSVVESNHRVRRVLTAGLPGLPTYRELEPFRTLVVPCRGACPARAPRGLVVERGVRERMGEIAGHLERVYARLQCAPRWTEAVLASERCRGLAPEDFLLVRAGDTLVGCAAVWDQSAFKQSVVRGYRRGIALARPALNRVAPLLGLPRLPPVGAPLPTAYLSHVAAETPEALATLVAAGRAAAARRGRELLLLGLAARHPLLPALRRRVRCLEYGSILYLVHWEDGAAAAAALDRRIAHVELATL